MAKAIELVAERRERAGKGAARAARRAGKIPGVIYGGKQPPVSITVEALELNRLLRDPAFFTHVFDVKVGNENHRVLPRDVQLDPVMDDPIHVDFLRVGDTTEIAVAVPVEFVNEAASPGLKMGGVLNVVRHEIEVMAKASAIPESIRVDLTGFELNASIHISAVTLPDGVRPTITDRDFTIATIAAPSGLRSEAATGEGEGEG